MGGQDTWSRLVVKTLGQDGWSTHLMKMGGQDIWSAIVGLLPQWSIFGIFLAIAKLDPKQFGKEFSVTFDLYDRGQVRSNLRSNHVKSNKILAWPTQLHLSNFVESQTMFQFNMTFWIPWYEMSKCQFYCKIIIFLSKNWICVYNQN